MKHITNKEWNDIVEQAFSAEQPEPPFSQRYRDRRLELERMVTMKEDRKFTFQPGLAVATAAALAIAAVPAGLVWHMSRNQITPPDAPEEIRIAPAASVNQPAEETAAPAENAALTELRDNSVKTFEFGWLPEGMYLHEDGPYEGKIHCDEESGEDARGITPDFTRLPENMTFHLFTEQVMQSEEDFRLEGARVQSGEFTESGNPYYWIFHNGNGWDEVWMQFSGTPYVMHLYYHGVTEEEIVQVLQNLYLVPAEEESAGTWVQPEERGPEELEFSLISDTTLTEANEQDNPWKGKILQETEIAGLTFETANLAQAMTGTQVYPALQVQYQKSGMFGDTMIDLMYTEAPAEEIHWGDDSDCYFKILDYDTFRVCVLAWNCTDEEIGTMTAAIETAASGEAPDDASMPEPTTDVPSFWLGYGVNSHGETYASAGQVHFDRTVYDRLPDLIRFGGDTYKEGFVRKTEMFEQLGDDPDDAMNHLMQDYNKTDTAVEVASLNVYDKEGETVLHVIKYYKEP